MIVKDISFAAPQENILYDDVLFSLAESGEAKEAIRFWESKQLFVVLGRIGNAHDDIHAGQVRKDYIPVLRRSSGGGTVLQGQGCLNYTFILSKDRGRQISDLRESYQFVLGLVVNALKECNIQASFQPTSDLALNANQKKFSGNAQKRGRKFIMHHGTILYNFDLTLIEKYLRMPKDMPAYRKERRHADFVTNIDVAVAPFKEKLAAAFGPAEFFYAVSPKENQKLQDFLKKNPCLVQL